MRRHCIEFCLSYIIFLLKDSVHLPFYKPISNFVSYQKLEFLLIPSPEATSQKNKFYLPLSSLNSLLIMNLNLIPLHFLLPLDEIPLSKFLCSYAICIRSNLKIRKTRERNCLLDQIYQV